MSKIIFVEKGKKYRHIKRGTEYTVIHIGTMQTSAFHYLDNVIVVIYQSNTDNRVWVRPFEEFTDGRFEEISL